jgi:hypothetical protein
MKPGVKAALWTGSVGLCVYLLRRAIVRRRASIDAGHVSGEWLAHRRGVTDDFTP